MLWQVAVALREGRYGKDRPSNGERDEAGFRLRRALRQRPKQLHQQQSDQPTAARDRHPAKRQTVAWLVAMVDQVKGDGSDDRRAEQIAEDAVAAPGRQRAVTHRVPCHFPRPVGFGLLARAHCRTHGTERGNAQRPDLAILCPLVQNKCSDSVDRQTNDRVPEEAGF